MIGYLIFSISIAVFGVIGNLLVIGTIIYDKRLHTVNNVFLANLAVADLFIAGVVQPVLAYGILEGKTPFYHDEQMKITYFCEFLGSFCVISCSASILSICAVAINRYVYICHNRSYTKLYSPRTVPFLIASIWLVGILLDLPNYFGFGNHVFHERVSTCFFDTTHVGYKIFFVIMGICAPVVITVYCYIGIVYLVQKNAKRLRESAKGVSSARRNTTIKSSDVRLLKTVAAMAVLAVIIYTPYTITLLLDNGQIHKRIWWFSNGLMHCFSCLDWIIYAISNKRIRGGMLAILSCGCRRQITEETDASMSDGTTNMSNVTSTLGTTNDTKNTNI